MLQLEKPFKAPSKKKQAPAPTVKKRVAREVPNDLETWISVDSKGQAFVGPIKLMDQIGWGKILYITETGRLCYSFQPDAPVDGIRLFQPAADFVAVGDKLKDNDFSVCGFRRRKKQLTCKTENFWVRVQD